MQVRTRICDCATYLHHTLDAFEVYENRVGWKVGGLFRVREVLGKNVLGLGMGGLQSIRPGLSHGCIPKGPKVVPFGGSYLEFYKVIPKRNYFGAFG